MTAPLQHRICLYCGKAVRKVKKGEHIVAEAIGGKPTISDFCRSRTVCTLCNNGVLSELDTELCSRSPLSIVAAEELDSFVWQIWDVDHAANNLLLEAKPEFQPRSMRLFPQIIFEQDGVELRGDRDDIDRFGKDRFQDLFVKHLRKAFIEYKSGNRSRLNPKQVRTNAVLGSRYRYPPRIFTRHPPEEFTTGMSFEFQYLNARDKRFALATLDNWNSSGRFQTCEVGIGSEVPAIRCRYDPRLVVRALMKLGVNLIAAFCPSTPVDSDSFREVIDVIVGRTPCDIRIVDSNGFILARDLAPIASPNSAHSFRLNYASGNWSVHCSFFGGRIGGFVRFPGQNREAWRSINIVGPLKSRDWTINTSDLERPLRAQIEWSDLAMMMPSADILNAQTELCTERIN